MSEPSSPKPRAARKSVAFTEEKIFVDADGSVTMVNSPDDDSKDTAQSHSARTPPLSAALGAFTDPSQAPVSETGDGAADANNDPDDLDLNLLKKKKKKPKKAEDEAGDADAAGEDGAAGEGDSLEGLLAKKKKKKKVAPKEGEDEFAKKLQALDLEGGEAAAEGEAETTEVDTGDMDKGTGVWQHDSTAAISFDLLLGRFFHLLAQKNPDHTLSGSKSYKIPPPQCLREGNKKTIFANIAEIAKRMNRTEEHVTAYLFAELGTSGSVDGARRLVIKGRFQGKQIEGVLRKYILEYVTCRTCRSPNTELKRGENRLYFLECKSCGSRRSVTAIKTGFSAQIGKRRKQG